MACHLHTHTHTRSTAVYCEAGFVMNPITGHYVQLLCSHTSANLAFWFN